MLDTVTLRSIAAARLEDAETLLANARYDGAAYICGYAMELALKARVCDTLGWAGYPETRKEFEDLLSFKTHNLQVLLHLSGRESLITQNVLTEWSIVANNWKPEMRYRPIGAISPAAVQALIHSTHVLLPLL